MGPFGIPGSWVLSTFQNSRASIFSGNCFKMEVSSLYTCAQQRKKNPASDMKSKLFPRAYGGQFLRSIKETQSKNLHSSEKTAHLVTYIQYTFVYQWTQWLRWKIAKAFVYFAATFPEWGFPRSFLVLPRLFTSFQPVSRGGGWSVLATVLST